MKIFLDTADIEEIRTAARWGVLDGVTTNPTLYAKVGGSYDDILQEVCKITSGPVSAEVVADDVEGMLDGGPPLRHARAEHRGQGRDERERPRGHQPLRRGRHQDQLHADLHRQPGPARGQGRGVSLLSPFVGRLDDINQDGMIVIRELAEIVAIHELDTEVLAASIRNPLHMTQAALAGAHVATLPFKVLQQMVHHPLTDKGIVQFKKDWTEAREAAAAKA